eukprot:TRINITY_DN369_c1_g5_i1.p1 TRINITY_DN369_c1_g5~~TRINITY_DN369_c1_g5_i1.p1  ORF type:complete len:594 (+),score=101.79 TRINITY_DN369_c1_g5_i1:1481-3262(+)
MVFSGSLCGSITCIATHQVAVVFLYLGGVLSNRRFTRVDKPVAKSMGVRYKRGSFRPGNLVQLYGSVFPYAFVPALLSATIAAVVKYVATDEALQIMEHWLLRPMTNNLGFTAYTAFVSFLVTFRTSKAYDRFWNGANYIKKMQAEFFVTASNLFAFIRSSSEQEKKLKFQHTLIRLLSTLHAVALHQLGAGGDGVNIAKQPLPRFELIDVRGLDADTLKVIVKEECRVELIIQWVQSLTVDGIKSGVCTIPPPILSRIFQNLSNALTAYYSAYRVTEVPYPFPYVQTTEFMLLLHLISTPFMMQVFTSNPMWAAICTFIPIFVLLSVNFIAAELENPFNDTRNVLSMPSLQKDFNKRLCLLIKSTTNRVPFLSDACTFDTSRLQDHESQISLAELWEDLELSHPKEECDGTLNRTTSATPVLMPNVKVAPETSGTPAPPQAAPAAPNEAGPAVIKVSNEAMAPAQAVVMAAPSGAGDSSATAALGERAGEALQLAKEILASPPPPLTPTPTTADTAATGTAAGEPTAAPAANAAGGVVGTPAEAVQRSPRHPLAPEAKQGATLDSNGQGPPNAGGTLLPASEVPPLGVPLVC